MPEQISQEVHQITVIGGDLRLIYLAISLSKQGYPVSVYGNHPSFYPLSREDSDYFIQHINSSESFSLAVKNSDVLILPIPATKDGEHITLCKMYESITLSSFLSLLTHKPLVIGGAMKPALTSFFRDHNIPYCDLMKLEPVAISNAIATAEGTILEAIKRSNINLHGSNGLVLGYGRCAKILAQKLKGLDMNVTVAARKPEALAYASAYGMTAITLSAALNNLSSYDYIFNTIPSMILKHDALVSTKPDVTIIDIASAPGGVDFNAAKELERNASLCLALPGIYSPKTSSDILLNSILELL